MQINIEATATAGTAKPSSVLEAQLVLEDGTLFEGRSRGAAGEVWGEVVFNTGMTGYQEIITDPSSCGHILTMSFPLMGGYGINKEDFESKSPYIRGFIAREICSSPGNWRSVQTLPGYLQEQGIVAMDGVDTRALVRLIREKGSMRGVLTTAGTPYPLLLEKARQSPSLSAQDLVAAVTTPETYIPGNDLHGGYGNKSGGDSRGKNWNWKKNQNGSVKNVSARNRDGYAGDENDGNVNIRGGSAGGPNLVILDLGLKFSLMHALQSEGCHITVVPAATPALEIAKLKPDGIVLAGGPGDPRMAGAAIKAVQEIAGRTPLLGFGLGHQVIALALGGKTYKLKFGHRGANHPVKNLLTQRVYITSQNHGFAVKEEGLPAGLAVTHRHLHDDTVEGLQDEKLKIVTRQYCPGDFPGTTEPQHPFNLFWEYVQG